MFIERYPARWTEQAIDLASCKWRSGATARAPISICGQADAIPRTIDGGEHA
jgi:hypothetical protein